MKDRKKNIEYDPQDVRQGEIVLKRPWQRWVFALGLFGGIVWALILSWLFGWYG